MVLILANRQKNDNPLLTSTATPEGQMPATTSYQVQAMQAKENKEKAKARENGHEQWKDATLTADKSKAVNKKKVDSTITGLTAGAAAGAVAGARVHNPIGLVVGTIGGAVSGGIAGAIHGHDYEDKMRKVQASEDNAKAIAKKKEAEKRKTKKKSQSKGKHQEKNKHHKKKQKQNADQQEMDRQIHDPIDPSNQPVHHHSHQVIGNGYYGTNSSPHAQPTWSPSLTYTAPTNGSQSTYAPSTPTPQVDYRDHSTYVPQNDSGQMNSNTVASSNYGFNHQAEQNSEQRQNQGQSSIANANQVRQDYSQTNTPGMDNTSGKVANDMANTLQSNIQNQTQPSMQQSQSKVADGPEA